MFSSSKCNQFSIIQSARNKLGNGKPQLTPCKAARKAKLWPEVWHPCCAPWRWMDILQVLLSLTGLNWELLNKLLKQN